MMDWLTYASGALTLPTDATSTEVLAKLRFAEAQRFLTVSGRVSPQDWAALAPESRDLLVQAAVQLENEKAVLYARAVLRLQAHPEEIGI